jgi:hypothetical protein
MRFQKSATTACDDPPDHAVIGQYRCPNRLKKSAIGRCAMARLDSGYTPRGNPCAQCGRPISIPEWVETGPQRMSYLWHCLACDYRFEAVAFFDERQPSHEPIAA